jgi:hypothetical protein
MKKPVSNLELQRLLGHKRYEPIWYLATKIRQRMKQSQILEAESFLETKIRNRSRRGQSFSERKKEGQSSLSFSLAGSGHEFLLSIKLIPTVRSVESPHEYVDRKKASISRVLWWNLRRILIGVHHSVSQKYLMGYLNEYTFKFNYRHLGPDKFFAFLAGAV